MVALATAPLEIGDVARALGVSVDTVRRWERERVIAPAVRTSSGRRVFSPADVEAIRRAREDRAAALVASRPATSAA